MIEVFATRRPFKRAIEIVLVSRDDRGERVAKPLQWSEPTGADQFPGELVDPTFSLRDDQAQQLMDELWRCGLRPTDGTGSAGSLAATERHLKDMQTIAMAALRKEGVQV